MGYVFQPSRRGFTLLEVLIASMIGVFVAAVAVGTFRAVAANGERVDMNIDKAGEVRYAAAVLRRDLNNIYRDRNTNRFKFEALLEQTDLGPVLILTFYTLSRTPARIGEPEGDVYEVSYYLMRDKDKSVLMRRYWPNPDKEADPGGILTVLAEDIDVFEASFYDGAEWQIEWPEVMQAIPELVELRLVGKAPQYGDAVAEIMLINFLRSTGTDLEESEGQDDTE
jgi:type II secretion system protein J